MLVKLFGVFPLTCGTAPTATADTPEEVVKVATSAVTPVPEETVTPIVPAGVFQKYGIWSLRSLTEKTAAF